ncbi:hypothetical protein K2X33_15570 [bacterium]|nr:hypothetical protein [bacterium]
MFVLNRFVFFCFLLFSPSGFSAVQGPFFQTLNCRTAIPDLYEDPLLFHSIPTHESLPLMGFLYEGSGSEVELLITPYFAADAHYELINRALSRHPTVRSLWLGELLITNTGNAGNPTPRITRINETSGQWKAFLDRAAGVKQTHLGRPCALPHGEKHENSAWNLMGVLKGGRPELVGVQVSVEPWEEGKMRPHLSDDLNDLVETLRSIENAAHDADINVNHSIRTVMVNAIGFLNLYLRSEEIVLDAAIFQRARRPLLLFLGLMKHHYGEDSNIRRAIHILKSFEPKHMAVWKQDPERLALDILVSALMSLAHNQSLVSRVSLEPR